MQSYHDLTLKELSNVKSAVYDFLKVECALQTYRNNKKRDKGI